MLLSPRCLCCRRFAARPRSSWSKFWGDDGYIRMARTPGDGNDCGVTTDPVLAVVHPTHAKPGSAAAQLLASLQAPAAAGGRAQAPAGDEVLAVS